MKYSNVPAKITHFINQDFRLTGIIHIGANDGEEIPFYKEIGIKNLICIEPIPSKCRDILGYHPDVKVIECATGDTDCTADLHLTNDQSKKGSSLLEDVEDKLAFNNGGTSVETIKVDVRRMDKICGEIQDEIKNFNCIVIDVQGYELQTLIGFGSCINLFDFWSIECSRDPVYKGEHPAKEIIRYMKEHGFTQDSPIEEHNDIFFVSQHIKPRSAQIFRGE